VDLLKIDGEYVRSLGSENDPTDRLIIEAVVKLARGLNTTVIAEFVGDQETRQELLAMGVHLGQGSLLGSTQDVSEIEALRPALQAAGQSSKQTRPATVKRAAQHREACQPDPEQRVGSGRSGSHQHPISTVSPLPPVLA
jgi:EAL domain-containing protein (putative c-di-GMP-specific phosphodiesterase class I)